MTTNEHDTDPRDRMRRLLVAALLGEASVEERAEVERAVAADPGLAAERDRLEATVGLVRGLQAEGAGEHLSPAASARLADAAAQRGSGPRPVAGARPARRAWYASPVLRMAASVAILAGAFAAWRAAQQLAPASGEAAEGAAYTYGILGEAPAESGDTLLARAPSSAQAPASRPGVAGREVSGGYEPGGKSSEGKSSDGGEVAALPFVVAGGEVAVVDAPGAPETTANEVYSVQLGQQLRMLDELGDQPDGSGAPGSIRYLRAEMQESELELARESLAIGSTIEAGGGGGGTYRGAGDVAPPRARVDNLTSAAAGVTPSSPKSAGPTTPGPVTASTPTPAGGEVQARRLYSSVDPSTGSDDFYLGRRPVDAERVVALDFDQEVAQGAASLEGKDVYSLLERLDQLGYGDPAAPEAGLKGLGYVGGADEDRFGYGGGRRKVRRLTPEQRHTLVEELIVSCRRRPREQPRDMFYRWWGDNPFELARVDSLSTFSVDVDTASYALARRYLADGLLPEKAQIRTEEFVNYFRGDVPPPSEETFRIAAELAPSLFNRSADTWMLRVAIRGREVSREERKPVALTFVVDVSGSMKEQSRLELVKHAMRLLVGELDARDSLSIVAFTNDARLVLPMTSARHRGLIESAIHPLAPEGGTNVEAGLRMGYEAALAGLASEANNRVVLLSDGVGNIGETDAQRLNEQVERHRRSGIYLNTVGVGMNNHNDAFLEQLADKGDGICNYVDDEREARRALVENFTGAFEPIARDAKVQVEFDPAQVVRYRLLGYENRAVADRDFRNDAVDAGEVGSGHQVVALYEVVRSGRSDPEVPFATVRLRWKPPLRELVSNQLVDVPAREMAQPVFAHDAVGSFAATSAGYRRSVLVAQLAEFLRRSIHARDDSFEALLGESRKLVGELGDPDFEEFVRMVERTVELISAEWGRYGVVARRLDALRMQNYLRAQLEDLAVELDRERVEQIDAQIQDLEAEVRELINRQDGVRAR